MLFVLVIPVRVARTRSQTRYSEPDTVIALRAQVEELQRALNELKINSAARKSIARQWVEWAWSSMTKWRFPPIRGASPQGVAIQEEPVEQCKTLLQCA